MDLKRKLLETRIIALSQVLEKARASEAAGHQLNTVAHKYQGNSVLKVNTTQLKK